jgi:hypothetical protein
MEEAGERHVTEEASATSTTEVSTSLSGVRGSLFWLYLIRYPKNTRLLRISREYWVDGRDGEPSGMPPSLMLGDELSVGVEIAEEVTRL